MHDETVLQDTGHASGLWMTHIVQSDRVLGAAECHQLWCAQNLHGEDAKRLGACWYIDRFIEALNR